MARVTVVNHVTLDGVMQSPAAPDEDTRGGFELGGWAIAGNDEVMAREMGKGMQQEGALLFGRGTYEHFFSVWPHRDDGNPFTEVLNRTQKYVVSNTLGEPLPWQNSTLLTGDPTESVAEVKRERAGKLTILGSQNLLQTLIPAGLIDRYLLMIHPLVLGAGARLFGDGTHARLRLADTVTTTTGVVIATYDAIGD
jgi:dihydrofolate reductase